MSWQATRWAVVPWCCSCYFTSGSVHACLFAAVSRCCFSCLLLESCQTMQWVAVSHVVPFIFCQDTDAQGDGLHAVFFCQLNICALLQSVLWHLVSFMSPFFLLLSSSRILSLSLFAWVARKDEECFPLTFSCFTDLDRSMAAKSLATHPVESLGHSVNRFQFQTSQSVRKSTTLQVTL